MSNSSELDRVAEPATPQVAPTQATAVEQTRAVAEVQAAVQVAIQFPRDMGRVWAEMETACGRTALAEQAFYKVKNRGEGPTVHLARELARIFGNVDFGVHELRRDDTAGMSEIRAYAWDQEKNNRISRTFQVPHARMAQGERRPLTDLQDVYLNNQNIGARAVRECIMNALPRDFVERAKEICAATLRDGEGKPLEQRITEMIAAFKAWDVTQKQMETRIGRKRSAWTAGDVADMATVYQSIKRGETTVVEEFADRVSADEITGKQSGQQGDADVPEVALPENQKQEQQ